MGSMDWDDSALIAAYDAAVDSYRNDGGSDSHSRRKLKRRNRKALTNDSSIPPRKVAALAPTPDSSSQTPLRSNPQENQAPQEQMPPQPAPFHYPQTSYYPPSYHYPSHPTHDPYASYYGQYSYHGSHYPAAPSPMAPPAQFPTGAPTIPNLPSFAPFQSNKELGKILLAWYNAGYSTGRYQALQEMNNKR